MRVAVLAEGNCAHGQPLGVLLVEASDSSVCVGHWAALADFAPVDEHENVINGDVVLVDARRNIIHAESATVAIVGADDLVVVQTEDAILVCPRDKAQDVRKIVDALPAKDREDLR